MEKGSWQPGCFNDTFGEIRQRRAVEGRLDATASVFQNLLPYTMTQRNVVPHHMGMRRGYNSCTLMNIGLSDAIVFSKEGFVAIRISVGPCRGL